MLIPLVLVLQSGPATSAWSTARPPECAALESGRAGNVWERAKAPELRKYCDLLASGSTKLAGASSNVPEVLALADQAEKLFPGKAAPRVLRGRALAQSGKYEQALAILKEARSKDERALDDPHALLAFARSLARTGNLKDASDAYRALLPRASLLTLADRVSASLEAGVLAMGRGPTGLDEAVPIFRQALRDSQDVAQLLSAVALALALDRAGDAAEAKALLAERVHGDARAILAGSRAKDILGPLAGAELPAMTGLALENVDAPAARAEWTKYIEANAKGPWIDHARQHEEKLAGKKGPKRVSLPPPEEPPKPTEVKVGTKVHLGEGLYIEDTLVGQGTQATTGKRVTVHYVGKFQNGSVFDSSRSRGTPFNFDLGRGQVIKGWERGVPGMKIGGKRTLTIPPALAYGDNGSPPTIPPKSTLIFDVELLGVQ